MRTFFILPTLILVTLTLWIDNTLAQSGWIPQASGTAKDLWSVSFSDANTGIAVGGAVSGGSGAILRTTNGGVTWTPQVPPTTNALYSVFFTDADTGTIVGDLLTILRTTNGGTTWTVQLSGTAGRLLGVYFTDANTGTAVGEVPSNPSAGLILRTTDGGTTWSSQPNPATAHLGGVFFTDPQTGIATGDHGIILRTSDAGGTWISIPNPVSGSTLALADISFTDANTGTLVGTNHFAGTIGAILRTTDGGLTWIRQGPSTTGFFGVSFTDAKTGWVSGVGGTILHTTDGGATWTQQQSGTTEILWGISFSNAYTGIVVGFHGTILRTTTGGWLAPLPPTLVSPADGSTNQPVSLTLRWNGTSGGFTYRLQVSHDSMFGTTEFDESTLTDTSGQVSPLTGYTKYYWRVNAKNSGGTGSWSSVWSFTTVTRIPVSKGWNLVSVSMIVSDYRKDTLFPTAISPAYAYEGSYVPKETLANRIGYWVRFPSAQEVVFGGLGITEDTLDVVGGWNLIGSISLPIAAAAITSIPPAIVTSKFFGYHGGYFPMDTLYPGRGSWVKSTQDGKLVLSYTGGAAMANRIRIIATSELPPPSPEGAAAEKDLVPTEFGLEQNYPNPFNPTTHFGFRIANFGFVSLKVYDVLGREVAMLVNEMKNPGRYEVVWDASNVASGVYFYRMRAGLFSDVKKLLLMR